eukprot:gene8545-biopygen1602
MASTTMVVFCGPVKTNSSVTKLTHAATKLVPTNQTPRVHLRGFARPRHPDARNAPTGFPRQVVQCQDQPLLPSVSFARPERACAEGGATTWRDSSTPRSGHCKYTLLYARTHTGVKRRSAAGTGVGHARARGGTHTGFSPVSVSVIASEGRPWWRGGHTVAHGHTVCAAYRRERARWCRPDLRAWRVPHRSLEGAASEPGGCRIGAWRVPHRSLEGAASEPGGCRIRQAGESERGRGPDAVAQYDSKKQTRTGRGPDAGTRHSQHLCGTSRTFRIRMYGKETHYAPALCSRAPCTVPRLKELNSVDGTFRH